jgi:hypothetical protein
LALGQAAVAAARHVAADRAPSAHEANGAAARSAYDRPLRSTIDDLPVAPAKLPVSASSTRSGSPCA